MESVVPGVAWLRLIMPSLWLTRAFEQEFLGSGWWSVEPRD